MGKKMKFPFLFKTTETTSSTAASASAWPWPACVNTPKTLSFRATTATTGNIFKTMNSAYLDDDDVVRNTNTAAEFAETPDSFSSINKTFDRHHFHDEESFSAESETNCEQPTTDETAAVIRGLRSDRLFFDPGATNSILEEAKAAHDFPYKETAAVMAMDSCDPLLDFRVSMEEMVETHGLKSWDCLEELLAFYLRVNVKSNHGYIVGAFMDLLFHRALASSASSSNDDATVSSSTSAIDERCSSSSTATQYSFTSPLSFSSSTYSSTSTPCLSLLENEDENNVVDKDVNASSSSSSGVC